MNALTHEFLTRWQHDFRVMMKAAPNRTPPVWLNPVDRHANPWPSIAGATAAMEHVGRDAPGPDAPPVFYERHRLAWLNLLRAAATAAGHGDDDAPRWHRMTAAELADELTYLADYQA